jgi:hypothetical protein
MSDVPAKRPRMAGALWFVAVLALVALGLTSGGFAGLVTEALGKVRLSAVLATLPGQAVAMLVCAAALYALRPGVSYAACLGSRLLRDASMNLLLLLPGMGEAIGARALVLAGGRTRAALTASALDRFAEAVAQLPFIALAAYVLLSQWDRFAGRARSFDISLPVVAGVAAALAALALAGFGLARAKGGLAGRLAARVSEEYKLVVEEYHRQKTGLPASIGLHVVGWLMSGVQVWMAALAFGMGLSLYEAIAMESVAFAGRAIFFFIPAGLVAQETGLVAAGLVFGIAAPQSLALGLVLRLRDVVFGLPLLLWPAYEFRHGRGSGNRSAH